LQDRANLLEFHSQVSEYALSVRGSWRDLDQINDQMAVSHMCLVEKNNELRSVSMDQEPLFSHQAMGSARKK
jgi:hypothetical protein